MTNDIAICYSGSIRTLEYCIQNHVSIFGDSDIYISTWSDSQRVDKINDPWHKKLNKNIPAQIDEKYIESIVPNEFVLKDLKIENYNKNYVKYNKSLNYKGLSFQYLKIKDCYELLKKNNYSYKYIIRLRCDITIDNAFFEKNKITIPEYTWYNYHYDQSKNICMNEMIWICNDSLMEKTVSVYNNLETISEMSSEELYGESITLKSFQIEKIDSFLSPKPYNYRVWR